MVEEKEPFNGFVKQPGGRTEESVLNNFVSNLGSHCARLGKCHQPCASKNRKDHLRRNILSLSKLGLSPGD
jgi:hypothetical protein